MNDKVTDLSVLKLLVSSVETSVSFVTCKMLPATSLSNFLQACGKVKSLSLGKCVNDGMWESVLDAISEYCVGVEALDFSHSSLIHPENLDTLTAKCKSLTDLDISFCHGWVDCECIEILAVNSPQLCRLEVDYCTNFDDDCCVAIAQHCRNLRHLSARFCNSLSDDGLVALAAGCAEIRTLLLTRDERITSQGIIILAQGCTKLEEIGIPRCDGQVDLAIAALVQYCPALKVVRSSSSFISDQALQSLQNCPLLHTLELTYNHEISSSALLQLLSHCGSLQRLEASSLICTTECVTPAVRNACYSSKLVHVSFAYCKSLTDSVFMALISHCPYVTTLDLEWCTGLADASIMAVASHCSLLKSVDFSFTKFTDTAMCALLIPQNSRHLISFMARYCNSLTNSTAAALANSCPYLKHLDMSGCDILTDVGVLDVLQKCRKVREIALRGCDRITNNIMDAIVGPQQLRGARLRLLDLNYCPNITQAAVNFVSHFTSPL